MIDPVKNALKQARQSLQINEPEDAVDSCNEVLATDKDNYFALLFKGKGLSMMGKNKEAMDSYHKAAELRPNDLSVWKGMLAVSSKETDYREFFSNVLGWATCLQESHQNLRPCCDEIDRYMDRYKNASYLDSLKVYYYHQIIPGLSDLGDLLGEMVANPADSLRSLIFVLEKKEKKDSAKAVSSAKSKLTKGKGTDARAIEYEFYATSEVPRLYDMLLNTETDDDRRCQEEEDFLKYKYGMLRVAPNNQQKELYKDVYDYASGLVLVKVRSRYAYELYFDWTDPKVLSDIELSVVADYVNQFGTSGLGAALYAYILSDMSPYDLKDVGKYLKVGGKKQGKKQGKKRKGRKERKEKKSESPEEHEEPESTEDEKGDDKADDNTDDKTDEGGDDTDAKSRKKTKEPRYSQLPVSECLDLMLSAVQKSKQSIMAHRILINYCIQHKEYQYALDFLQAFVRLVLNHQRATGTQLANSRLDSVLDLAIIYTYHEAPKNFPQALNMYSTVLRMDPDNIQAKLGRGLILMENGKYKKAADSLKAVVLENPDDTRALQEYGWCLVQLGEYAEGREYILRAMQMISGTDANSLENKSTALWRLGESYLLELKSKKASRSEVSESVKLAYSYFLQCVKISATYAPCYASLGEIYMTYYGNYQKALKCFYKAFDLDPAQLVASRELVKHFSSKQDWEMVEVISTRVIDSEHARKQLIGKEAEDPSWPFRMLGCCAMERQDDVKAIEHFQNALRLTPTDPESWIGLGEAYLGRGRLEASKKVFTRVLELEPENWHATYLLAISLSMMTDYQEAIQQLKKLAYGEQSKEACVLSALYETLILKAQHEVDTGFIGRSLHTILDAIDVLENGALLDAKSQKLWKSLGDMMQLCTRVQSHASHLPFDKLDSILKVADGQPASALVSEVSREDGLEGDSPEDDPILKCYDYAVRAGKNGLNILPVKSARALRAGLLYNLAVAYLGYFSETERGELRDCAIKLLKKAIQLEGGNAEFWTALGIATFTRNGKVSQHCFIKASSLDPRSTIIWVDLGSLYLYYGDYELANQCFMRAQSIAPAGYGPWAGQAMAADAEGNDSKARRLYTHSFVLSNGKQPLSGLLYGLSTVKKLVGSSTKESDLDAVQQFSAADFGMLNYLKFYPKDKLALEVIVTVIERIHRFGQGEKLSVQLCDILEENYEKTEDESLLLPYAEAKSQLARLQLGGKKYEDAISNAEMCSNLLSESEDLGEQSQKCLLSSLAVIGLASYFTDDFDRALEEFNKILEVFPDAKRVVVLVAQVLYAFGEEETKQAAVEELFKNIESYGSSLLVVLTVASISVVDDLRDYLPAVRDELDGMTTEARIKDTSAQIPFFVDQINSLLQDRADARVWQRSAFMFPEEVQVWKHLGTKAALQVAVNSNKIDAGTVAESYIKTGRLREIQRGLFMNPTSANGYKALRGCF